MDIDSNVANVLKRIEEYGLMEKFPINDEKVKKNFLDNWMKLYREDLSELLSLEDHTNDEIEAQISSLSSMVDERMVTLANSRKEGPKECSRALRDRCKAIEDYYSRLVTEGEKFTVSGTGDAEEPKKSDQEDFNREIKQDLAYLKSIVSTYGGSKDSIKLGSSVAQLSGELEKANKLCLFETKELEKKILDDLVKR